MEAAADQDVLSFPPAHATPQGHAGAGFAQRGGRGEGVVCNTAVRAPTGPGRAGGGSTQPLWVTPLWGISVWGEEAAPH